MVIFLLSICFMFCTSLFSEQSLTNDVLEHLQTQQVHVVSFLFVDITGEIRAIDVPINQAHKAIEEGLTFDGSSVPGCSDISSSDMLIKPDIETMRIVPWFMGVNKLAVIICDIYKDEKNQIPRLTSHNAQTISRRSTSAWIYAQCRG